MFAGCNNKQQPMNVLFIAVDDFRPQIHALGCDEVITPDLDKLVNEGVAFMKTYCQWPVCGPSRASIMTGLRAEHTGVFNNGTPVDRTIPDHITLPGHFRQNGYYTAEIGKVYHSGREDQKSWDFRERGKWQNYGNPDNYNFDKTTEGRPMFECEDRPDEDYTDGQAAAKAIKLLENIKDTTFFLAVGFYKPHMPFACPKKYWDMYDPDNLKLASYSNAPNGVAPTVYQWTELMQYNEFNWVDSIIDYRESYLKEEDAKKMNHGYNACVSFISAQVGKLLNKLEELDLDKNTIVVLWGDHGFHLGDQNIFGKHALYERTTNVPLLIRAPGMKLNGKTSNAIAELVDVYPTLADLCGLPAPKRNDGISLKPILMKKKKFIKKEAFTQYNPFMPAQSHLFGTTVVTDQYRYTNWQNKYFHYRTVYEEFYDYKNVREEIKNQAGNDYYEEIQKNLETHLKTNLEKVRSNDFIPPVTMKASKNEERITVSSKATVVYNPCISILRIMYTIDLTKVEIRSSSGLIIAEQPLNDYGGTIVDAKDWHSGKYKVLFYQAGSKAPVLTKEVNISSKNSILQHESEKNRASVN